MLNTTTLISNYQLLELLGFIRPTIDGEFLQLSRHALVLKDDVPDEALRKCPLPKDCRVCPLNRVVFGQAYTKKALENMLQEAHYLKYLRVFFAEFKPDSEGKITQKADMWDGIKAWRYDIDVVKDEDLVKDRDAAIQRINDKEKDIIALIDKLPLKPNILKRSNKGWHLIYVFDRFIIREDYDTYLKLYNKPGYNKPDDYIADQFIVFELISEHIPNYLAGLEPQLDVQASKVISSIATRFITEDLPAYLLHEPYELKEFRKAFEFLMPKEQKVYEEVVYKQGKTPYTVNDIPKNTFLSLMDRCGVLKALDEDWENHTEYEWYVMTNYYAIRILYADTPEEAEQLRKEFHDKSSRWIGNGNKHYTYNEAERQLQYYIRKQEEGLKPPACKYIYHNLSSKYTTICHTCPYRKFDTSGNMIANFIFDGLKNDSLEDITIPGWELRDDGWYMEIRDNKDELNSPPIWIRILPYFKIRTYYLVGGANFTELIDVVDKQGISTIHVLERRKDTLKVNPADIVVPYGRINTSWDRAIKTFLTDYIEAVKEKRGVKIKFLGIRYINGFWDIAVGGYGNYRRSNLAFIFYGQEISKKWFVPSVQGSLETFKDIYYHAFLLNDPPLHIAIAHFLSWIGMQFIENKSFELEINPILIFVGDSETGKSIRAKIAAGLYGNPALFSFSNISQAGFSNKFPLIRCPFVIDEVITKNPRSEEKLGELLYNIGNKSGKMTAYATHDPIEVPVILIGETENFLIDKLFSIYRGLVRRSIVIRMTTEFVNNSDTLDYLLEELRSNYGHIITYAKSLTDNDREVIEEEAKKIYEWGLKFGKSSLKEMKKHLALSLAMFKHFYRYFIGMSEDEIDDKIKKVIDFVSKDVTENQLHKIGDTIDYIQEVLDFISSVLKAEKQGETLKGMNYKGIIEKIQYKPSDKVGKLLRKFFWKKYISGTSTTLSFMYSILIINPFKFDYEKGEDVITQPDIVRADRERLEELTDEEIKIWADILKLKYDNETIQKIVTVLGNQRLRKIIYPENA